MWGNTDGDEVVACRDVGWKRVSVIASVDMKLEGMDCSGDQEE